MSIKEYKYEVGRFKVTPEMKADFDAKGYVVVRNLLSKAELEKLQSVINKDDAVIKKYSYGVDDGAGRESRMCLWWNPGDDLSGRLFRCQKVAGTCGQLLGGEVDHYATKLMMKDAHTGGRFVWHQDYGYWYDSGFLFPDMATVFIALDPCRKNNGCLEVLEGSHRCGRIEHNKTAGQVGADVERVEHVKASCPHRHVEMDPGDALFFHCNLIHASSGNNSPHRRWAFLCGYNKADNKSTLDRMKPFCTRIEKVVPDSAILECKVDWDLESTEFFVKEIRDEYWKTFEKLPENTNSTPV